MGVIRHSDLEGNDLHKGYKSVGSNPNYVLRTKLLEIDSMILDEGDNYDLNHGLDYDTIRNIDIFIKPLYDAEVASLYYYPPFYVPHIPSGQYHVAPTTSGHYYSYHLQPNRIRMEFNYGSIKTFTSGNVQAMITYTDTEINTNE